MPLPVHKPVSTESCAYKLSITVFLYYRFLMSRWLPCMSAADITWCCRCSSYVRGYRDRCSATSASVHWKLSSARDRSEGVDLILRVSHIFGLCM